MFCPTRRIAGAAAALATMALLSACATTGPQISATKEAAQYAAHAAHSYAPPGPPADPWGPYITEAAARFDVPDRWIREVMRVESGGHVFLNGQPIVSDAGAMGLMQVMPETFDEMRARYGLGDDPFDPHNSILAGAAYIREMYDMYGSPGFLAAYNAGPGRLDDYLLRNKPLPDETRHYVAMIGPNIAGISPATRSQADEYAANAMPVTIPSGPRFAPVQVARNAPSRREPAPVQMAAAAPPDPAPQLPPAPELAAFEPPIPPRRNGFHLFPSAMADTLPQRPGRGGGAWAIQVGAFGNEAQARAALGQAREKAGAALAAARPTVTPLAQGRAVLYRARLSGLSRDAAVDACEHLGHHGGCMVLSPDAQS